MSRVEPTSAPPRVLCVSYYFPPAGGVGVQRVLKFVKYLPEFGWRPIVLTVREDAAFPVLDPSLAHQVPQEVRVERTRIVELYRLYRRFAGSRDPIEFAGRSGARGTAAALLRSVRASLFIPDGRVGWIPFALRRADRILREEPVAALFSSGPPFTTHRIAASIAREHRLPWIADFRDPWTRAPFYPDRPRPLRAIDERHERSTVRSADLVVAVNRRILDDFESRLLADRRRLVWIPNGFDPEDFARIPRIEPEKLTYVHAGSLFASRDPAALRAALADLCRGEPGFADRFELLLAGRVDPEVAAALRAAPLDRIVRQLGTLPHREALALLRRAHACLLLVGEEREREGMVTGKVYEYLGSGTPVVALAPPGEAAELVLSCRAGAVLDPQDEGAIREHLRSTWRRWLAREPLFPEPDREAIARYSRRRQAGELAALLDRLRAERSRTDRSLVR